MTEVPYKGCKCEGTGVAIVYPNTGVYTTEVQKKGVLIFCHCPVGKWLKDTVLDSEGGKDGRQ